MTAEDDRQTTTDTSLNRQRVVTEAFRLADSEGVDRFSMRKLAGVLGAGAMSLYHYVATKEALLDGMVDLVFAEIELPTSEGDWREAMRRQLASARDVLVRHAWAVSLMGSRTYAGPAGLRYREAVAACLRRAGFSIEMTVRASWLLNSCVYGYVLQEVSLPCDTANELAEMADEVYMPLLTPDRHRFMYETASTRLAGGYDHTAEFAFGLDVVIEALERLRVPSARHD